MSLSPPLVNIDRGFVKKTFLNNLTLMEQDELIVWFLMGVALFEIGTTLLL